jgi:hypothetical protein
MTEEQIDGDFTACDTAVLNRFFAAYRNSHGQGETNTRQRNLHPLFKCHALPGTASGGGRSGVAW